MRILYSSLVPRSSLDNASRSCLVSPLCLPNTAAVVAPRFGMTQRRPLQPGRTSFNLAHALDPRIILDGYDRGANPHLGVSSATLKSSFLDPFFSKSTRLDDADDAELRTRQRSPTSIRAIDRAKEAYRNSR